MQNRKNPQLNFIKEIKLFFQQFCNHKLRLKFFKKEFDEFYCEIFKHRLMAFIDYYKILGVNKNASEEEIKKSIQKAGAKNIIPI